MLKRSHYFKGAFLKSFCSQSATEYRAELAYINHVVNFRLVINQKRFLNLIQRNANYKNSALTKLLNLLYKSFNIKGKDL